MDIKNLYKTASFKWGGHTVITVKIILPSPVGDGESELRISGFYSRLCEEYTALAKRMAEERGEELWKKYRRPILLSVSFEEAKSPKPVKRKKSNKSRNGYAFLRTERISGMGNVVKKRSEYDFFLADGGFIFS